MKNEQLSRVFSCTPPSCMLSFRISLEVRLRNPEVFISFPNWTYSYAFSLETKPTFNATYPLIRNSCCFWQATIPFHLCIVQDMHAISQIWEFGWQGIMLVGHRSLSVHFTLSIRSFMWKCYCTYGRTLRYGFLAEKRGHVIVEGWQGVHDAHCAVAGGPQ